VDVIELNNHNRLDATIGKSIMRIGITGFGFMGQMHYGHWMQMPEARVVAICDSNPDIVKSFDKVSGNIPGLPDNIDFSNLHVYTDFEEMLREEQLDGVSITLPTYLHAELSCKALRAGVHVLCEKPMALNIQQCRQMIDTAEQTGKYLMVAHCIRFWPEYAHAYRIVHSGEYGDVRVANFQRLSSKPLWSSNNWLMDSQRSGGMVQDLHIHDTDYIHYLFGMPSGVYSRTITSGGMVEHIKTDYLYDADMLVHAEASWLASDSFKFRMNFEILLEKATIVYDCTKEPAYQIYPDNGDSFSPSISKNDGYRAEIEYFLNRIQGKVSDEIITMQQSLESIRIVEAERASSVSGNIVRLTPQGEISDE